MAAVKINKLLAFTALCSSLLAGIAESREIPTNTARLQAMDKITGKVSIVDVPVNGHAEYGTFSIVVRSCKTRSPEETPENFAYVDVVDNYQSENPVNIFRGWMMSSSPALNAVAHPIYDVWLLKCLNTEIDKSKLMSDEELRIRNNIAKKQDNRVENEKSALPPVSKQVSENKNETTMEEKIIEGGSAIENPAEAVETLPSIEEEAEKAIAEFQKAKNAEKSVASETQPTEETLSLPDENAPQALIKINPDGTAETPKYETKPAVAPVTEDDIPGDFIVIKKDAEPQVDNEVSVPAEDNGGDMVITPEHEAMLPELLNNAKPISPDELKDADVSAIPDIAEEIPLVTGDEIEENGMVDEEQLIELEEPDALPDIQAESLAE